MQKKSLLSWSTPKLQQLKSKLTLGGTAEIAETNGAFNSGG